MSVAVTCKKFTVFSNFTQH